MPSQNTIGACIRLKRKALDLTRQGLADRIGYSAATICKIETEERRPSAQVIEQLAEIFNVPPNERTAFLKFARGDMQYIPGDAAANEPWRISTEATRSNLPAPTTSLIGREQDILSVCEQIRNNNIRLVTLVGPPGIGKTRISIAVGRALQSDFSGKVFYIALASLGTQILLAATIAQSLGIVGEKNLSTIKQLIASIGESKILLVLDNCEHLIEDVASLAHELLTSCSQLKILATSRESLRITGEWLYQVPVLLVPQDDFPIDFLRSKEYPALTLFTERARAVQSKFVLDESNIGIVTAICTRLDGLPLAIELISARIRAMSPQMIYEQLSGQFVLSTDGMRAPTTRQKTLNNAIGWSYNLLSAEEQYYFDCLSVFSGGFTLDAVETILSEKVTRNAAALVTSLLDKSLLTRIFDDESGRPRFNMLVTIQAFASYRLLHRGAEDDIRSLHFMYFYNLAEKANHEINGPNQIEWLERLHAERDNLRTALEWAIKTGQTEAGLKMTRNLSWFWFKREDINESLRWLERILSQPDAPHYYTAYADALSHFANHTWYQGGSNKTIPFVEEALAIARAHNDKYNSAQALMFLGKFLADEQCFTTAHTKFEESQSLFRELGEEWEESAHVVLAMAYGSYLQEDWASSLALHEQALAGFRKFGDIFFQIVCLRFVGYLQTKQGNIIHGTKALKDSLILARQLKSKHEIALILLTLADTMLSSKKIGHAIRLYLAAKKINVMIGVWQEKDEEVLGKNLTACQVDLDELTFRTAITQGNTMTTEQAIAFALEVCESIE